MNSVAVVVPTYNEAAVIGTVLDQLLARGHLIVVVDDGSADETYGIIRQRPVVALRHAVNLGQGAALQTGLSYVCGRSDIGFVVTFDSDGQHLAGDIDALLRPLREQQCDVALGSRFLAGAVAENMSRSKRLTLKLAIAATRVATGLRVTDVHNGLRAFRIEVARRLNLHHNRMAHASEILTFISRQRLRYREVPVHIVYTAYSTRKGQTAFHSLNILWELLTARLG